MSRTRFAGSVQADGTVLCVTLSGMPITLSSGAATMTPFVLNSDLRKKGIQIFTSPPPITNGEPTVLSGGF